VGLVSYYKLDETSGDVVDSHGDNNGTNYGATRGVAGKINNAFSFDGDDYVEVPNDASLNFGSGNFTISIWVKYSSSDLMKFVMKGAEGGGGKRYALVTYDGKISVAIDDDTVAKNVLSTETYNDSKWHYVVGVRDGNNLRLYIDNVEETPTDITGYGDIDDATRPLVFGRRSDTSEGFYTGLLDEIIIWNRTLTSDEISQLFGLITLISPEDNAKFTTTNINFSANVSDPYSLGIENVTIEVWNTDTDTLSYNNTNSSGSEGVYNWTKNLPNGNYNWTVYSVDSTNNATFSSNTRVFQIQRFYLKNMTYNSNTYETKEETFTINITTNGTQTTSAEFFYGGINQGVSTKTGTDANANFSNTIQIPTGVGNKTFYWQITIGATKMNTTATNQTVSSIQLGLCNATLTVPYINFTFKDEETDSTLNATIDTSTWEYWLGDGTYTKELLFSNTTENPSYAFCFTPGTETLHNTRSVQYASSGYPQRKYDASSDLTNSTTNQILYLLSSADGIYTSIHVVDQTITNVVGITVTVERQFAGVWTVVGQEVTGDAGLVTFWVNPDYDHRFTFVGDDCEGTVTVIRPTQTQYTQQLSCGVEVEAEYISPFKGIDYSISPKGGTWLPEETVYPFTFNITANLGNLVFYSINITDKDGNLLNSTCGTTSTGGNLTVFLDTTGYDKLYGYYYIDIGNGTILMDPSLWPVSDIEAGRGSIKTFFINLIGSEPDIEDNYSTLMLIFTVLFVGFAAFCFSTGMELTQPGITLFILFFFVAIFSISGYFTIDFAPSDFINKYGILLVVFFLTGGYALGQWAKT